jgi:hypothetical protein
MIENSRDIIESFIPSASWPVFIEYKSGIHMIVYDTQYHIPNISRYI